VSFMRRAPCPFAQPVPLRATQDQNGWRPWLPFVWLTTWPDVALAWSQSADI